MKNVFISFFISIIAFPSGAQSSKEATLFSVNKKPVSSNEFIYLYQKNHKGRPDEFTNQKVEEYLDLYIKFKLKVEEARQRGMDTTATFIKEFLGYKDALRKPYLPDNKLVDSLTQLTYERMKQEVKASHLLIRVAPDATPADTLAAFNKISDLKKRIDAGEDFGTLAVTFSEDPSAKSNEGSLGYFTAMQMVYPFESGAYNTPIGQVGNPVRTRFGYHLIKVVDKRLAMGEVEVSHLLIRTGKDRDSNKARAQAYDVYEKLQGGMKWDDLCKQYSEDQSSKDSGGKLRAFGVGAMASVPEFEKMAFSLAQPGDYSAPFSTQYGWHIVKLEKKIPLPPYKELEASLKSRVSRDERMQTAKATIQKNLRTKYKFVEDADAKKIALSKTDSTLLKAEWKKPVLAIAQPLFTINGKTTSVEKFFDYIVANQKASKASPAAYINQLYEAFVEASIQQAVEEELMATNADYRYLSNEYYEGILLFDIMEKEVWNRASEDTVGQAAYFAAHSARYLAGERAEATIYSGKAAALDELNKLLEQDSVVTDEWLKKNSIRTERGKFEKAERPALAAGTWVPGLTRTDLDGNNYLVKIERILPAGPRTLEEARGLLISDYQNHLETEWVKVLRAKYPVKINSKAKKYAWGKLIPANG